MALTLEQIHEAALYLALRNSRVELAICGDRITAGTPTPGEVE